MKQLNSLKVMLSLTCSMGYLSAAHLEGGSQDTSTSMGSDQVEVTPAAKTRAVTLSEVNKKRNDGEVKVLFALPPLTGNARPDYSSTKGFASCMVEGFEINGQKYDLWSNYSNWDLETKGGVAEHRIDRGCGEYTKETWYSRYYLVKQGILPGESENALIIDGALLKGFASNLFKGPVFVFYGEIFLVQKNAPYYDNEENRRKDLQADEARKIALATRGKSS
jgi:hypothetical protein